MWGAVCPMFAGGRSPGWTRWCPSLHRARQPMSFRSLALFLTGCQLGRSGGGWGCSCSPPTEALPLSPPQAALQHGVIAGRRGFGSIFVVASGNGGHHNDNCNYDGYANSIYTVTIGNGSASAGLFVLSSSPGQVPSQDGCPSLALGEPRCPDGWGAVWATGEQRNGICTLCHSRCRTVSRFSSQDLGSMLLREALAVFPLSVSSSSEPGAEAEFRGMA